MNLPFRSTVLIGALCIMAAAPRPMVGQSIREMIRREMALDQETRKELAPRETLGQTALFDYGAFVRTSVGRFHSSRAGQRLARTFRSLDVRVWSALTLADVHKFYFRLRTDLVDWNEGQEFSSSKFRRGPNVDQLFYMVNLDEWAEKSLGQKWPFRARLTVGRQYQSIGSCMVYNMVNDGVQLEAQTSAWDLKLLGARTIGRIKNIDRSPTLGNGTRYFAGIEVGYAGIPNHRPYMFLLVQQDETNGRWPAVTTDGATVQQKFNYDSQYFGLGATGQVFRNLGYHFEGVIEQGQSYGDASRKASNRYGEDTEDIEAYAFNAGLDYYFTHRSRPRMSLDYFIASGDRDRIQPLDTAGGNAPGTADRGFIGFGFVDTGYALSPEFANLQFVRLDGSFRPLYAFNAFRELEWGATGFLFWTQQPRGGISDPLAVNTAKNIGSEADSYINWRIFSDTSLSFRYGIFFPGSKYAQKRAYQFILATLTYSF